MAKVRSKGPRWAGRARTPDSGARNEFILLFEAEDQTYVDLVQGALESEGIPTIRGQLFAGVVQADDVGVVPTVCHPLYVHRRSEADARKVLASLAPPDESGDGHSASIVRARARATRLLWLFLPPLVLAILGTMVVLYQSCATM